MNVESAYRFRCVLTKFEGTLARLKVGKLHLRPLVARPGLLVFARVRKGTAKALERIVETLLWELENVEAEEVHSWFGPFRWPGCGAVATPSHSADARPVITYYDPGARQLMLDS